MTYVKCRNGSQSVCTHSYCQTEGTKTDRQYDPELLAKVSAVLDDTTDEPGWSRMVIAKRILDALADDIAPEPVASVSAAAVPDLLAALQEALDRARLDPRLRGGEGRG